MSDADVDQGLRWFGVVTVAVRVLALARVVTLARIAGPHAFGVFASVFAFAATASLVAELGLRPYLIHRGEHANAEAKVVARMAVVSASAVALVLAATAPLISRLYGERDAGAVAVALAAWVWLGGFAVVPSALLRSTKKFREAALVLLIAEVGGTAVALAAAISGQRVWALVAAVTANQVLATAAALAWARRIPRGDAPIEQRQTIRRKAFRYGMTVTLGSAVWAVALQGDNVTVGKVAGATALGFYAFAYNYGIAPATLLGSTISDVSLVAFSHAATDTARKEQFLRFVRIASAVSSPIVAIGCAFAHAGVAVVLGHFWTPAVGALRVMLVVGWFRALLPTESLLRSTGRVGVELRVGLFAAPVTILAAAIGAHHTVATTAALVGLVLSIAGVVAVGIALRGVRMPVRNVVGATAPSTGLAIAVALGGLALAKALGLPDAVKVAVAAPLALFAYGVVMARLRPDDWAELVAVLRPGTHAENTDTDGDRRTLVVLAHFGWDVAFMQFHKALCAELARRGYSVIWVDERVRLKDGISAWLRAFPSGITSRELGMVRLRPWTIPGERFGERVPLSQAAIARAVKRHLRATSQQCDILLAYTPMENATARRLHPQQLVYWTGDEVIMKHEAWLVAHADLILAISDAAMAQKSAVAPGRVHRVSTGVDVARFADVVEVPDELTALPRPLLGYVGALSDQRIDVELIRAAARANPNGTVVLVGAEHGQFLDDALLPDNVTRLGARPYDRVPAFVAAFDVGLVPYKDNAFNRGSDPLKVHEYLATGLPVVATDLPAVRVYDGLVSMTSSPEDFGVEAMRLVASRHDAAAVNARKRAASAQGIDRIAERIMGIFDGVIKADSAP